MLKATAYTLFLCLLLGQSTSVRAQNGGKELREKDLRELAAAQALMPLGRYDEAIAKVDRLLKRYPKRAELHLLRGELLREQGNYPEAIDYLSRGLELENGRRAYTHRMLGEVNTLAGNYAAALENYENYLAGLQRNGRRAEVLKGARQLLEQARTTAELAANPHDFSPVPLGPGVNTEASLEYFPSLSVDGERLIFTRRVGGQQEDFYLSERLPTGEWGPATPLAGINTEFNEGAQTITADGNYLVFTGCGRRGGQGSCDLYYSERRGERWTPARNLGPTLNTRASESQPSLSADGRLLFFASNRPGGQGGDDLYVSGRQPDGSWSPPVNLGPAVNTAGNDRYPFWAADGKTLYFTSTGWPGMGGADLFKTQVDAQNKWEKPTNLGYPINTPGEETNLFVALDGRSAYFSKGVDRDIDIYTFELPTAVRPAPATYVQVRVVDAESGRPLDAEVRLQPLYAGSQTSISRTDAAGRYLTVLPSGIDYGFSVEKDGYLFYSDRFNLEGEHTADEPFRLDIRLQPLDGPMEFGAAEEDGAIVLRNVFFETASDSLVDLSTEELDRLVGVLEARPGVGVEIAGHTDDVGSEQANQELSERRARSVKRYLVAQGITADRISAVGYGESRPVAPNDTEGGRARNRRTTFRLLPPN